MRGLNSLTCGAALRPSCSPPAEAQWDPAQRSRTVWLEWSAPWTLRKATCSQLGLRFWGCFPPGCYCVENKEVRIKGIFELILTRSFMYFIILWFLISDIVLGVRMDTVSSHALVSFPTSYYEVLLNWLSFQYQCQSALQQSCCFVQPPALITSLSVPSSLTHITQ